MDYKYHPASEIFPPLGGAEFVKLCSDIRENGLKVPIVLHPDGSVLDGRNRLRACKEMGISPVVVSWAGKVGTEIEYVISLNLVRRHLNPSQLGMIVARIADMRHGNVKGPRGTLLSEAVKTVPGASSRTAKRAHVVVSEGTPEQVASVDSGEATTAEVVREIRGEPKKPKPPVVKPTEKLEAENRDLRTWGDENAQNVKDLLAENESMAKVFNADDKLKAATDEIARLTKINAVLSTRIGGLQNEAAELGKLVKMWRSRFEKLEKVHAKC